MQEIRLKLVDTEITVSGELLIKKIEVINGDSGDSLRIAKITLELVDFLKHIEIDVTNFMNYQELIKKNSKLQILSDTLKLYR